MASVETTAAAHGSSFLSFSSHVVEMETTDVEATDYLAAMMDSAAIAAAHGSSSSSFSSAAVETAMATMDAAVAASSNF